MQPGDPRKAATALLHVATLDEPPLRLPLGIDAARAVEEAERARIEADKKWRQLSESTDFEGSGGQGKTWLITGASTGLGYALAKHVLEGDAS
jgi:hypothetical protein